MDTIILLGSSRVNGNTHKLVKKFNEDKQAKIYNLLDYSIANFDYNHKNKDDDFIPLVKDILKYDHWVFATPVYWYSMSSQMKVFFDRLTDLLTIRKELGRKLRNKSCSVLSTGSDPQAPNSFEEPFILTANYLGMNYKKMLYCSCASEFNSKEYSSELVEFIDFIYK